MLNARLTHARQTRIAPPTDGQSSLASPRSSPLPPSILTLQDPTSSAASSPSTAYAGLTLESNDSTAGTPSYTADRRDSMTEETNTNNASGMSPRPQPRASSPAKRTASEMEGEHQEEVEVCMEIDRESRTQQPPNQESSSASRMGSGSSSAHDSTASTAATSDGVTENTQSQPMGSDERPSYEDQVRQVLQLVNEKEDEEGQVVYLVSSLWLQRVMSRTEEGKKQKTFENSSREGEVGPVDNSSITGPIDMHLVDEEGDPFIPLKPGLREGEDFQFIPEEAWDLITKWYGLATGSHAIRRFQHNTAVEGSINPEWAFEYYPPIFTIRKVPGASSSSLGDSEIQAPRLLVSKSQRFQIFLAKAKEAAGIDIGTKVKVWRELQVLPTGPTIKVNGGTSGILTPDTSRSPSPSAATVSSNPKLIMNVKTFTEMAEGTQREMIDVTDHTNDKNYNGHAQMSTVGLAMDQVVILEEQAKQSKDGKEEFVSDKTRKMTTNNTNGIIVSVSNKDKAQKNSGRDSPAPSGPITRGRSRRDGKTRGCTGLSNLGNTCYMNSALQCIRSVEELTQYFLLEKYKKDLNTDNPIGHGGNVAKAYSALVHSIYDMDTSTFAPRVFKNTIGRYQAMFTGYGQQDSQEFLSFLVDALHEDLNRVRKKPPVDNPDSTDEIVRDEKKLAEFAEIFRENYRKRNDSVVADLFSGFYKNKIDCPKCGRISINFDPYSLLTLQLPVEQTWKHTVLFARLRDRPIKVEVDIDKNATIRTLKHYIAKRFPGTDPRKLFAAEVWSHKIYRAFEDNAVISDSNMQPRDDIWIYELEDVPSFALSKPKKKRSMLEIEPSDDEMDIVPSPTDHMLVTVLHRSQRNSSYNLSYDPASSPLMLTLSSEEACSYDAILRKVLNGVSTMTTRPIFREVGVSSESVSRKNSEFTEVTDDESSNVQTRSVDSEDGMVEVSMTEPLAELEDTAQQEGSASSVDSPVFLQPGDSIAPGLRNLFDMSYLMAENTSWSLDMTKKLSRLESRIPKRRDSVESSTSSTTTSEEGEDDALHSNNGSFENLHPQAEASDEEIPPSDNITKALNAAKYNKKARHSKDKRHATYSRKGQRTQQARQTPRARPTSEPQTDGDQNPALIRAGEMLILDWGAESYDALFGGHGGDDDLRGEETFKGDNMPTFEDPEIEAIQQKRAHRKKTGLSLEDCFAETTKTEVLTADNQWYCNRCKEHISAHKTLSIWTLPDILVIHLKRFATGRRYGWGNDKIELLVDAPVEGLDLTHKVGLDEGKAPIYDLFAVDNHYGGLGGGHYTAYAKNFYDGLWYEYNDSSVTRANPNKVVTSAAYLLFYRRRSDGPLGPESLKKIVHDSRSLTVDSVNSEDTTNPNSQASSRAPSPTSGSGNGPQLGDSAYHSGLPGSHRAAGAGVATATGTGTGTAGAAAGALRGGAGSDGVGPGDEMDLATEMRESIEPAYGDVLPTYGQAVDEGYGDDEADGINFSTGYQLQNQTPGWSFGDLDDIRGYGGNRNAGADSVVGDADSSVAAGAGSMDGGDLESRMMEDFGDDEPLQHSTFGDIAAFRPGQTSRAGSPDLYADEMPELVSQVAGAVGTQRSDSPPAVDIHVDEGDDLKMD